MSFDRKGFNRQVGIRLRRERENRGLTQSDLAEVLEMPRSSYANIERGRQRVPADVVWRVAVALDLQVKDLLPKALEGPDLDVAGTADRAEVLDLTDDDAMEISETTGT